MEERFHGFAVGYRTKSVDLENLIAGLHKFVTL